MKRVLIITLLALSHFMWGQNTYDTLGIACDPIVFPEDDYRITQINCLPEGLEVVITDQDGFEISRDTVLNCDVESDLYVTKELLQPNFFVNDTIQFVITVGNNGPDDEPMAYVMDQISDVLVATSSSCGFDFVNDMWVIGPLASGATVQCTIDVVTLTPNVYNTALVAGSNSDPNPLNNVSIISYFPPPAPEARVSMTNPDVVSGTFDATWDFTQLGGQVPDGECVSVDVILIDTMSGNEVLWETLTGLSGDDISTFTSTEVTANYSVIDHSTGTIGHGLTTMTDKRSWAFASGNGGANASKMIFEVTVGGTCSGNLISILPSSVNLDNRDEAGKVRHWIVENSVDDNNISSTYLSGIIFDPAGWKNVPNATTGELMGGLVQVDSSIIAAPGIGTLGPASIWAEGNSAVPITTHIAGDGDNLVYFVVNGTKYSLGTLDTGIPLIDAGVNNAQNVSPTSGNPGAIWSVEVGQTIEANAVDLFDSIYSSSYSRAELIAKGWQPRINIEYGALFFATSSDIDASLDAFQTYSVEWGGYATFETGEEFTSNF